MPIGSSPFLTADVDEPLSFSAQWSPETRRQMSGDGVSARVELIRRRVLTGYYSSPEIAHELAQRLIELDVHTG